MVGKSKRSDICATGVGRAEAIRTGQMSEFSAVQIEFSTTAATVHAYITTNQSNPFSKYTTVHRHPQDAKVLRTCTYVLRSWPTEL